jgi:exodeoxyribonuclease VII small subunit
MPRAKLKEKPASQTEPASFEQALAELEQIVGRLESGQLPLDEALALFERGQHLTAWCGAQLDSAELKIQKLAPKLDGYTLQDLDEAETEG